MLVTQDTTSLERTDAEYCGGNYISYEKRLVKLNSYSPDLNITCSIEKQVTDVWVNLTINNSAYSFLTSQTPQYTDLDINGTQYANVYELENYQVNNDIIDFKTVYYNKDYGILQIKLNNNETITRKP